ncbi:MAG: nitroreductase family deazaflavin-dependent oxidoreductase [Actinomycetota bacterium]|nr:nitroreductase family deazaflavin-dependent oxidoreductase [Actinomycetota bacterium]
MRDADVRFPRALAWIARHRWGRWLSTKLYTPADKVVYRLTGGRRGLSPSKTVMLLTTTGRKTGRRRQVPVLYLQDGERLWVMASNYGQERHPGWSANLLANPEATVHVAGEERRVTARPATEEERRTLWPRLMKLYPAWEQYARWTDRSFRLFCLEPAGAGQGKS